MKRFLCGLIAIILVLPLGVYADTAETDRMQKALVSVKTKVDIPGELTEFTPYANEYRGKVSYTFSWQKEDGSASTEIVADESGRIQNYYFYDRDLKSDKKLTALSKQDIVDFAADFAQKALPEAYTDVDTLVFRDKSWNVNNLNYNLEFVRMHDGIEVKDNVVSMRITVYEDKAYVRSMYVNYNYDAAFEAAGDRITDYAQKYREAFAEEIIYKDEYGTDKEMPTALVYRFKDGNAGYILASTGEVATEDPRDMGGDEIFNTADKEMASGSASREDVLTEKELSELSKIKGLISADEAQKLVGKLPHVKMDSSLKRQSYNISERNGRYIVSADYQNSDKTYYLSVAFDGESGELISLYARKPSDSKTDLAMTDAQKEAATKNIQEFLRAAAGDKLKEFALVNTDESKMNVSCDYDREVNSIRYINDGIYVSYSAEHGMITSYSMDYDAAKSFEAPEGIIDADKAYEALTKLAPLKEVYMLTGGSYKVCYTVSEQGKEIDAYTGEQYLSYTWSDNKSYEYKDIESHWAKEKIEKLSEVQIGFEGDAFRPDEAASQYDILRIFAAGVHDRYYLDYTEEELYDMLISDRVISKEQKAPEATVTREEAFVFMIRLACLEDVAKLSQIFKVEYRDGHLLSDGIIGYPAILTGMGIICGNEGMLRPRDSITRAEAAVMVYNYMVR